MAAAFACSSSSNGNSSPGGSVDGGSTQDDAGGAVGNLDGAGPGGKADGASSGGDDGGGNPGKDGGSDGGIPSGWLYTSGAKIYVSKGDGTGTPWMGRGVNVDDIFFCGYNNTLYMATPDSTVETVLSGLMSGWKPTFLRMSLGMDSYTTTTTWLGDAGAIYRTPMTAILKNIGTYPGVYVLVTLRSDASMIGQDETDGDPEATGIPSDSTTTPNAANYPTGTDATYVALVDSFASDGFVLFGLTNEPGGNKQTNATLSAAMSHAVGVIRAEEDRLGVPHHVVSVQGNSWTSDISFYATTPLPYDNVVYEIHGYPPTTASYTYSNIPVILGEYGTLSDAGAFFSDVEAKQIPNLAWDFESYSDCSPDLLQVNQSATNLVPSAWGTTVQAYLLAH